MKVILGALFLCTLFVVNVSAAGQCEGTMGSKKQQCCVNHPNSTHCK